MEESAVQSSLAFSRTCIGVAVLLRLVVKCE